MRYYSLFLFVPVALFSGCAGQRPPEGGPVDSTPPEIISVYPAPQTTHFNDNKVVFEFSEYVDRRSVEEAIFISPSIEQKEFKWSGTEVELYFLEELKKNTTYVITVGTDVRDVRAGNRMAKSYSLSFSTGERIDNGMITGKVFDENPDKSGVMIFSYRLNEINADTLNPAFTKPDYLTQTGKDGDFRLTNLALGTYRLFAVRDEYRNLLYDPETDAVGTTDDLLLTDKDTVKQGIQFILAKEDTTAPRITSVQSLDNRHVAVVLSEPIDTATISPASVLISDTLKQRLLAVYDVYPNNLQGTSFTVITDEQQKDSLYLFFVREYLKDKSGFSISPLANRKLFTGSSVDDTLPPAIIFSSIKDTAAKIFSDDSILIMFSDAISFVNNDSAVALLKFKDSSSASYHLSWCNSSTMVITPVTPLRVEEKYLLILRWNYFPDRFGNRRKDSTTTFVVTIDDPENYGSIEGKVVGASKKRVVIQARNITDKKQAPKQVTTSSSDKFSLSRLPEGRYVLKIFEDVNNNFTHDAGTPFPFKQAERFSFYPDTIRVRPRWPVDGVMLKF